MPAYFSGPYPLAATGSTGNTTHAGIDVNPASAGHTFQFVVEAVGATPTVTWKVQGSPDNVYWYDVTYVTDASDTAASAARVVTVIGGSIQFLSNPVARQFKWYRLVTSANTNVTYRCDAYGTTN